MRSLPALNHDVPARRSFSCFVRGEPKAKGSMRGFVVRTKTGGLRAALTSDSRKGLGQWQGNVSAALQERWAGPPMEGAVRVELGFQLLRPASVSEKKRKSPTVKPDVDKLVRAVLDAMKSICFRDDAQVVEVVARKEYAAEAGVAIAITEEGAG